MVDVDFLLGWISDVIVPAGRRRHRHHIISEQEVMCDNNIAKLLPFSLVDKY